MLISCHASINTLVIIQVYSAKYCLEEINTRVRAHTHTRTYISIYGDAYGVMFNIIRIGYGDPNSNLRWDWENVTNPSILFPVIGK